MTSWVRSRSNDLARFCARATLALCLVAFGFGGAVERGFGAHVSFDAAATLALDAGADVHHDGPSAPDGALADHGCHGCPALPLPRPHGAARLTVVAAAPAWASRPSATGRAPLVDLPPPRA